MKRFLRQCYNSIAEADPQLDLRTKPARAAIVLMHAAKFGPDAQKLAREIELFSHWEIEKYLNAGRAGGLIQGGKIRAEDWSDPETGGAGFWCDVNVLLGYMEKVPA